MLKIMRFITPYICFLMALAAFAKTIMKLGSEADPISLVTVSIIPAGLIFVGVQMIIQNTSEQKNQSPD